MSAHRLRSDLSLADWKIPDPGAGGTIDTRLSGVVEIVTAGAGAEARALPIPTHLGQRITLCMKTDGGDCTVTVASAYDAAGSTTIVLDDAGDFVVLEAIRNGSALAWRLVGGSKQSISEPAIVAGLTASGSASNDFSGSTGTFKTSTGLNTLSGYAGLKTDATPVAAAGSTVADAGQLPSANFTKISSDGATKGVKLPTGVAGQFQVIENTSSTACELYAASGGTVNGLSADASVVIPASKGVLALCFAADTWIVYDLPAKATAS